MRNNDSPLVSVIMPTFNHGHYIGRAIQSLLDQSYNNWEAIVIDNFSADNTEELVLRFSDERIKYLKFSNNGVIGASRNVGIKLAKGDWIAFLDSDDWWHPSKLDEFHLRIEKKYDVFYHELEVINPTKTWKRQLIGSWQVKSPVQTDLLIRGNALATSSVIVRREILNRTSLFSEDQAMIACEDYNLWLKLGGLTDCFYYCPRVLGYYMNDGNGTSRKDMSTAYRNSIEPFIHNLNSSQRKYVEARIDYQKLRYAYLNKDYQFVKRSAMKSIVYGAVSYRIKSFVMYCASLVKS